jgi:hypothetical protein
MSRRAFGGWGWDLSDTEFGQALAALGVLLHAGSESGRLGRARRVVGPGDIARATSQSVDRYGELLSDVLQESNVPFIWDLSRLGSTRAQRLAALRRWPASTLAAAWARSAAEYPLYRFPLEVHPVRWLQPSWLFGILNLAFVRGSPYFPLPEPGGSLRWTWPLRVGFLTDGWSRSMRADLYRDQPDYFATLTVPETGPSRCDLLLIPAGAMSELDRLVMTPDATAVIVVKYGFETESGDHLPALAARLSAWCAALVDARYQRDFYRVLVRELSHARPLLHCLRDAGGVRMVFAAPDGATANPLYDAGGILARRMIGAGQVPEGDTLLELPPSAKRALNMVGQPTVLRAVGNALWDDELGYHSEGGDATDVSHVARAAQPVLEGAERNQARRRFIRAQVRDPSRPGYPQLHTGFRAGAINEVAVSIGPRDAAWLAADQPFPPAKLPPDPAGHLLTVVFTEPNLLPKPLIGTVQLPPFGSSDAAVFQLVPKIRSHVGARITVLHRGRILQTSVLRGEVFEGADLDKVEAEDTGPRIQVLIEAVLGAGATRLDDRQQFHAAVLLNHSPDGRPGGTIIGRQKAALLRLDRAADAVQQVRLTFDRAERDNAFGRKLGSKTSLRYLRRLALHGRNLYQLVGRHIESKVAAGVPLERIQVLSVNPNTMLPVEVIYDFPPPVADPSLCPNWQRALNNGRCDPQAFHTEDDEGHLNVVCPAGFWGVSKVIERQAVDPSRLAEDPETRGIDLAVVSVPVGDRSSLGGLAPVLFAASEHVNDVEPTELERVTNSLKKLTEGQLHQVETWKDWARQVRTTEPPMLLLLAHTELNTADGAALEIAKKAAPERRVVAEITRNYVNLNPDRPGPIVMLLGCDTAIPQNDFQSFVVQFYEMGTSLVVGTTAPVLGRHAGRAAEALIHQLREMADAPDVPDRGLAFGDAMLVIRRQLLAKGILMALCLTAYGDAGWRLAATRS